MEKFRYIDPVKGVTYLQDMSPPAPIANNTILDNFMVRNRHTMKKNDYDNIIGNPYNDFEDQIQTLTFNNSNKFTHASERNNKTYSIIDRDVLQQIDKNEEYNYDEENNDIKDTWTCQQVAKHIKNCEICLKIYSCDKSIHIISIIILSVLVLLLIRRFMDT